MIPNELPINTIYNMSLQNTYITTKKLFSPSFGFTIHRFTMSSSHARRIRSGVAGECNSNISFTLASLLAALIASRIAKKTEEPKKRGGSPTIKMRKCSWMRCTSSGSLNCSKILPFHILEETYSEILWDVPDISMVDGIEYNADGIL